MIYDLIPSDVTTKDKKVMNVDSFVIWEITDPVKYLSSLNASIEKAEVRLDNVVYNSIKTVMSATSQEEIISGRSGELAEAITNNIGTSMDSYGIRILAVETKKLDLPDSNKESVYQRMISERNNIAAQYTADGDYQSSLIRNETDRTVKETVAKAEAEAEMIKAEGEAQYMQILSNAYNDESKADFYNYVRSLDALKSSLKGTNKTIILNKNSELARILSGN
jgi:membrane protease subunit HflC